MTLEKFLAIVIFVAGAILITLCLCWIAYDSDDFDDYGW